MLSFEEKLCVCGWVVIKLCCTFFALPFGDGILGKLTSGFTLSFAV